MHKNSEAIVDDFASSEFEELCEARQELTPSLEAESSEVCSEVASIRDIDEISNAEER